jgi:hypothetical protein
LAIRLRWTERLFKIPTISQAKAKQPTRCAETIFGPMLQEHIDDPVGGWANLLGLLAAAIAGQL